MQRLFRATIVIFWLGVFFLRAWIAKITTKDLFRRRLLFIRNTSFCSKRMLKPFRIKVKVTNPEKLSLLKDGNHLIVSNHVSYTDILVLSSMHPFVFITSQEMGANPILGDITRMGGSLYTDRKKYTSLPQEIQNFAECLKQGFDVVLFPEGTSTNGETIREFRKSLFQISLTAQKPLLPICIKYTFLDNQPITTQEQRDKVCWYGDMTFIPHFWEILKHTIVVELVILDDIPFSPELTRQNLCDIVYSRLLTVYNNI